MEKYYVYAVDNHGFFAQSVALKNKADRLKQVTVSHFPDIPIGTKFKVYDTKGSFGITLAYSYKVNNMRYVDLPWRPTNHGIKKFWNNLSFFDRVRLNADIKQALRQHGVVPALNKNTNLRLFLGKTH
ncbi:MAG: hypothetical protein E7011_01430 [Alphaproteobacteria bacterium]|nr:hypothetical protein [Alphaproteobacteria bacterium]